MVDLTYLQHQVFDESLARISNLKLLRVATQSALRQSAYMAPLTHSCAMNDTIFYV